jgi:hypothetical protein
MCRPAVYVRGPNHEDLSLILEKVVFSLHPSFAQPVRELREPPFAVSEMGWGEFEASIRLFFKYVLACFVCLLLCVCLTLARFFDAETQTSNRSISFTSSSCTRGKRIS